jgi:hypothetical protein
MRCHMTSGRIWHRRSIAFPARFIRDGGLSALQVAATRSGADCGCHSAVSGASRRRDEPGSHHRPQPQKEPEMPDKDSALDVLIHGFRRRRADAVGQAIRRWTTSQVALSLRPRISSVALQIDRTSGVGGGDRHVRALRKQRRGPGDPIRFFDWAVRCPADHTPDLLGTAASFGMFGDRILRHTAQC